MTNTEFLEQYIARHGLPAGYNLSVHTDFDTRKRVVRLRPIPVTATELRE